MWSLIQSRSSLQSSAQILSHNLSQLIATFDAHRAFFSASHAYPLTNFPGQTKESLLNQLLRKRLEPQTEEWVKKYEATHGDASSLDRADLQQLWAFAGSRSNTIVQNMIDDGAFEDDFTIEERESGPENVKTGLRRNLLRNEGDVEQENDDQEMVDSEPFQGTHAQQAAITVADKDPIPLESILKVMSVGMPREEQE